MQHYANGLRILGLYDVIHNQITPMNFSLYLFMRVINSSPLRPFWALSKAPDLNMTKRKCKPDWLFCISRRRTHKVRYN